MVHRATFAFLAGFLLLSGIARAESADYYEAPGKLDAVDILARPYSFDEKGDFLAGVDDHLHFFEAAVVNLKSTPTGAKDEAKAYAQRAQAEISPLLAKAQKEFKAAKSAGAGDWQNSQASSRRALLDLERAYGDLHGNVRH